MHGIKPFIAFAALAGTSLAQKSDKEFCDAFFTSFLSVILESDAPTPTGIASWVAAQTPVTTAPPISVLDFASHAQELCHLATELPSSLLPEFQTYAADLLSWGKEFSSEHVAYVTDCAPESEVASRSSYLEYVFTATGNICTYTPAPGSTSGGSYPTVTPTPTSYSGSNSSTTWIVTAAAAKPTGACLGAAAMGGIILGAAALL
ncbi:hypothetical protein F5B22DRAFT_638665 [Xylaria bambusicola]|uniref:uncharacterized protein n=1 Tax=Xylaria bambusicola TaxID=326684 RepID=UPI0020073E1D|nr:uncharacterized protein F5B22DRAFT_638665 [Xylaria bambusicola]KAI0508436.1 hypothetical protein F5B22DRAFT_638665 [Xylaria bambusicola]